MHPGWSLKRTANSHEHATGAQDGLTDPTAEPGSPACAHTSAPAAHAALRCAIRVLFARLLDSRQRTVDRRASRGQVTHTTGDACACPTRLIHYLSPGSQSQKQRARAVCHQSVHCYVTLTRQGSCLATVGRLRDCECETEWRIDAAFWRNAAVLWCRDFMNMPRISAHRGS